MLSEQEPLVNLLKDDLRQVYETGALGFGWLNYIRYDSAGMGR